MASTFRPCVAVVPLKPFVEAKTRLSSCLPEAERAALAESMAAHVLAVLTGVPDLSVVVVSRDAVQRHWAETEFAAAPLAEAGGGDLNFALGLAARSLSAGATMLVVPGDLPLLQVADVVSAQALPGEPGIVLGPDRHGTGTNLLHVSHPAEFAWCFGPGSAEAHREVARTRGWAVRELRSEGVATDVDEPADLAFYRSRAA